MTFSKDFSFAALNQSQLQQIKQAEDTLNSGHGESNELILIAFEKNKV